MRALGFGLNRPKQVKSFLFHLVDDIWLWSHQFISFFICTVRLPVAYLGFLWELNEKYMSHIAVPGMQKSLISSVAQSCLTLCNPMDCSTPSLPDHHQLPGLTQTHVHRVSDAIQPAHPLSSPSPPAFNLSQHKGLFQWISSSHQVAEVLKFQLQHQSFQWIFRTDFFEESLKNAN